ncbi:hypothetical protein IFM89_023071 [Coptis chinensis]|uniref:Uncharacterized protein n=1 Tax=Coptis chinensis TaxID=261450 RepID=A0A835IAP5_9MAGN|nr:hypothetical protein IFM89_023071 [Coptis chinensis]
MSWIVRKKDVVVTMHIDTCPSRLLRQYWFQFKPPVKPVWFCVEKSHCNYNAFKLNHGVHRFLTVHTGGKTGSVLNQFNIKKLTRITRLATFLLEGSEKGEVKKNISDLERYEPRGLEECKRLARSHYKQLFTIYQNKEDPFFPWG